MQRPFLLCIRKCRTYPGVITAPEGFIASPGAAAATQVLWSTKRRPIGTR